MVSQPKTRRNGRAFPIQWIMLALVLTVIGASLGWRISREYREIEATQGERLRSKARVAAANLDRQLESIYFALLGIRDDLPAWRLEGNWKEASRRLRAFSRAMTGVRILLILDGKGKVLAANQTGLLGNDFSGRDYFRKARENPDQSAVFLSPPFRSSLDAHVMTMTVAATGYMGEFAGAITASLDPQFFLNLMDPVLYAPDMWVSIAHGDGSLFLINPNRATRPGLNLAVPGSFFTQHLKSGREESLSSGLVHATGETRLLALRTILPSSVPLDHPLVLAVSRDRETIHAGWRRGMKVQGLLFAAIALLTMAGLAVYQAFRKRHLREMEAAQAALEESELWLRSVFHSMDVAVFVGTPGRSLVNCNQAALAMFGFTMEEMQKGFPMALHLDKEHYEEFGGLIGKSAEGGEVLRFEFQFKRNSGEVFPCECTLGTLRNETGEPLGILYLMRDITERTRLESQDRMAKVMFENSPEGIVIADSAGKVRMVNDAYLGITGYSAGEVVGHDLDVFRSDAVDPGFSEELWRGLMERGRWSGEYWNRRRNGEAYPEWQNINIVRDRDGSIANIIILMHDITKMKRREENIKFQAYHDPLTGLPNRLLFNDRLERAVAQAGREGERLAVAFMDLDHFKQINDTLGHQAGDVLLQEVARRLKAGIRESDTASRLGGDEFTLILLKPGAKEETGHLLGRLRQSLHQPIAIQGREVSVTTSMGVAFYPDDAPDTKGLLEAADQAMYRVKEEGRNGCMMFEDL